jgi:hypothetical protein
MAEENQDNKKNIELLHEQLLKDNYAVPESIKEFEDTFKNPENAKKLYDQLTSDKYGIPSDFEEFQYTFGFKKKDVTAYGLPSKEVFSEIFSNITPSRPEDQQVVTKGNDLPWEPDKIKTPEELAQYSDTFKTPDLSLKQPKFDFKPATVRSTIGDYLWGNRLTDRELKPIIEEKISELDKKIAEFPPLRPGIEVPVSTSISTGPFGMIPKTEQYMSQEEKDLRKERDNLKMTITTPNKATYIIGRAYNQSIIGMADRLINGEFRANPQWLNKYDASIKTDLTASVVSLFLDSPIFMAGNVAGEVAGRAIATPLVKMAMNRTVQEWVVKGGIERGLAEKLSQKAAWKISSILPKMIGTGTSLGGYRFVTEALGSWSEEGNFKDINFGQTFKNSMRDFTLGLGIAGIGLGSSAIVQKAKTIPNVMGRMGAQIGTSAAGLTAESALFAYGGFALDNLMKGTNGTPIKPVTSKDFAETVALLSMLKISHAMQHPLETGANVYKSLKFDSNKPGEGVFKVDIEPWEINDLGGTNYKDLMDLLSKDDNVLGSILRSEKVPASLKSRILFGARGIAYSNRNILADKITQEKEYVNVYNKDGVLLDTQKFTSKEEAQQGAIEKNLQMEDNKMQRHIASLPVEDVSNAIAKLNESGIAKEKLVESLDTEVKQRSPEQSKMVADYYKFFPKGEIKEGPEELKIGDQTFASKEELFTYLDQNALNKENGTINDGWLDGKLTEWPNDETIKTIAEWKTATNKKLGFEVKSSEKPIITTTSPEEEEKKPPEGPTPPTGKRLYDYKIGDIVENSRTKEQFEVLEITKDKKVQMKDLKTGEIALNDGKLLHYTPVQKEIKPKGAKKPKGNFSSESRTGKALATTAGDFEDAVLQYFIGGGRVKIDDFIRYSGFPKGGAEFKKYFQLLSNNGASFDTFNEKIPNSFGMEEKGAMDMIGGIIDIMKANPSRGKMLDAFEGKQKKIAETINQELPPEIPPEVKEIQDIQDEIVIDEQNNELNDLVELSKGDKGIEEVVRAFETDFGTGIFDWDRFQRTIDNDPEFFEKDWLFNLKPEQITKLKTILSQNGKVEFEKIIEDNADIKGTSKRNIVSGGTASPEKPVGGKGEEKPVTGTNPEQQTRIDAINVDYDKQIADKKAKITQIQKDMDKAIQEAKMRPTLFGDLENLKKGAEVPLIKPEEQGFALTEESLKRVKLPFEEKIAEIHKDITALEQERKGKVATVLQQKELFGEEKQLTPEERLRNIEEKARDLGYVFEIEADADPDMTSINVFKEPREAGEIISVEDIPDVVKPLFDEYTKLVQDLGIKTEEVPVKKTKPPVEGPIKEATIVKFYADTPVGTKGKIVKSWTDPSGKEWFKLNFGTNLSGQKLEKSFPADVLDVGKNPEIRETPAEQIVQPKTVKLKRTWAGHVEGTVGEIVKRPNMFVTEVKFPNGKTETIDNTYLEFIKETPIEETGPSKEEPKPATKDEYAEIRPKAEDIPTETARRAYMGISFDPEKRAKEEQKSYVDQVNKVIDEMSPLAKNDEQKKILKDQITSYKIGLAEKTKAYLAASSRTMSSMITGPAKFPVERNRKAMDIADKRMGELITWDKKVQETIKKAILGARTPEEFQSDKFKRIKKTLDDNIATIIGLDTGKLTGYNRALFVNSMKGFIERMAKNGQVDDVRMALDYIRDVQAKLKKPIFAERNVVWDALNNAEKVAQAKETKKQTGEVELATYPGAKIVNNNDIDRIQITMDEKPSQEVMDALKKEGWHWSPANSSWQRKNTPQAVYSAQNIISKYYTPKEEIKPAAEEKPEVAGEYKYKMQLRPFDIGTFPKQGFVKAEKDPQGGYEILTYNRKLTSEERDHWSFTPLTEVAEIKGKNFVDEDDYFSKINLEWFGNDQYAKVSMYDKDGKLVDVTQGMRASEILKNIETGYWKEKGDVDAQVVKDLHIEPRVEDEEDKPPEGLAWDRPLPLTTNEDPDYKSSDLNNSLSIRDIGRNLVQNLGLKEGENVRTGLFKRFIRRSAGVFNPRSGVVRVKSVNDIRSLSHELGHYLDYFVFDIRGITGAKGTDQKTGIGGKYSEIVDANGISDKSLRSKRLNQLRTKFGPQIVDGVIQRNVFNHELKQFLENIGYPSKKRTEALAEFVYNYIIDPAQVIKDTPKFYAWFEKLIDNAPAIKEALSEARTQWNKYEAQDPRIKVLTLFEPTPKKEGFFDGIIKLDKDKILYSWVNHLRYWENISKDWKKIIGTGYSTSKDPYYSAKTMMGIDGRAQQWLLYHPYFHKGTDVEIRKDVEGLISILRPILGTEKDQDFRGYLLAKDSMESHQQGRPNEAAMPLELAKSSIALWEKQYGVRKLWDFQSQIQKYNESLLDFMVESGKMSQEGVDLIKSKHQYYVPLKRIFEDYEIGGGKRPISRDMLATSEKAVWSRKGSFKTIKDIYESMVENTYHILSAAERNIQLKNLRDAFFDIQKYNQEKKIPLSIIEEIPPYDIKAFRDLESGEMKFSLVKEKPKSGRIMDVWEEGKVHYYDVAPEYYDPLFQQEPKVQEVIRMLSLPSRWLQAGAVVYDPTFPIRNIMRDQQSAWFYSKFKYVPTDFIKGIASAIKKDEYFQKWLASGGDQSFLISADQMMEKDYAKKKVGRTFERKWATWSRNPLTFFQDFSRASEIGTRLGAFRNAYKKTKNVQLAAVESRDVSADYGIHGAKIRQALGLYPFLNARLQHARSMVESVKHPASFFMKGMAITAPALMNWLLNNQDEESTKLYQSLPTWRRVGLYNIRIPGTDHFIPIPKGFYGVLFGSSIESFMDSVIKDDPRVVEKFANQLFKEFSPVGNWTELVPFIIRPKIEVWANKKGYTGKPIISESMRLLKPAEQYYTPTPEIFKKIGETLNWSPLKIDHYIRSYTGGAGIGAVNILDEILQLTGIVDKKPEDNFTTISRLPVFKAFLTEKPIGLQSGYISDFYETLDKIVEVNATFNNFVKTEQYDKLEKFMEDPKNQRMYSFYEGNSTSINNFRAALTWVRDAGYAVMKDDLLTHKEKQEEIRKMNDVIQESVLKFKDAYDKQEFFDYGSAMDDMVKKMKASKKDYRSDLDQQQNSYNPFWIQLRSKDKDVYDRLREFGGLKEIEQRRSINAGMEKRDLQIEESRLFNEKLVENYGKNVKGFLGTKPENFQQAQSVSQPTTTNPNQTQLDYIFDLAWQTAMQQTTSEYLMNPIDKNKK